MRSTSRPTVRRSSALTCPGLSHSPCAQRLAFAPYSAWRTRAFRRVPFNAMSEAFHIRLLCLNVLSVPPMSPCPVKQPATPPGDQGWISPRSHTRRTSRFAPGDLVHDGDIACGRLQEDPMLQCTGPLRTPRTVLKWALDVRYTPQSLHSTMGFLQRKTRFQSISRFEAEYFKKMARGSQPSSKIRSRKAVADVTDVGLSVNTLPNAFVRRFHRPQEQYQTAFSLSSSQEGATRAISPRR